MFPIARLIWNTIWGSPSQEPPAAIAKLPAENTQNTLERTLPDKNFNFKSFDPDVSLLGMKCCCLALASYVNSQLDLESYRFCGIKDARLLAGPPGKGDVATSQVLVGRISHLSNSLMEEIPVIIFRGTYSKNDFLCDTMSVLEPVEKISEYGDEVGRGYVQKLSEIIGLNEFVSSQLPNKDQVQSILICGHSLGGALASVFSIMLARQYTNLNITLVTFGSMRPFHQDTALNWMGNSKNVTHHRFMNDDDVFTAIPNRLRNIGKVYYRQSGEATDWQEIEVGTDAGQDALCDLDAYFDNSGFDLAKRLLEFALVDNFDEHRLVSSRGYIAHFASSAAYQSAVASIQDEELKRVFAGIDEGVAALNILNR